MVKKQTMRFFLGSNRGIEPITTDPMGVWGLVPEYGPAVKMVSDN